MKILVIGESCKDTFVYCDALRLAPDVPVPVLNILYSKKNFGMAYNVWNNIIDLGISPKDCHLLTNDNYDSITKTRYIHDSSNHMFFRVDSPHNINRIEIPHEKIKDYDYIVISDYNKGYLHEDDINWICSHHPIVFLDSKKILGSWAEKSKFIKINNYEYNRSLSYIKLSDNIKNNIIRTDGAKGCFFRDKNYPTKSVDVKDSSGAGDTFLAGLVVSYFNTQNIIKSIHFANKCASFVVTKKGVTTCKDFKFKI